MFQTLNFRTEKKLIRIQVISSSLLIFLLSRIFKLFVYFISLIFMLKLDESFRNQETFLISFFNNSDLGLKSKKLFWQFLVDILPLRSEFVDLYIFADPDP